MKYLPSDITILLCVHSTAEWNDKALVFAIESLVRQELDGFKVLVVLDNCWGATHLAIRDYEYKDFRVVEKFDPNGKSGLANAKNFGLKKIRTPLVAFLDADDEYMPSKLQVQLDYLNEHPEIDFLGTHSLYREVDDLTITKPSIFDENSYNSHEDIEAAISTENVLTHGSMLIRMEALRSLGLYRHVKGAEDWDLWQRAFKAGFLFAQIPERLYIYTLNTSVTR